MPSQKPPRGGRPAFVPEKTQRRLVEVFKATGASNDLIALELGIPKRTLERHFKVELTEGKQRVLAKIGGGLLARALNGDNTASIFALKTLGGWNEHAKIQMVDADGNTVEPAAVASVHIHLPDNGRDTSE